MFSTATDDEVKKLAEKVGRKVHREYPSVDRSEITSVALAKLAEVKDELKAPTKGHLFRVLERAAFKYAADERYRVMLETSQYIYTSGEVRALLKKYWDPMGWKVPTGRDDYLQAEVDQRVVGVSLIDLQVCMEDLKPNYKRDLERKYKDCHPIHNELVQRAIDALVRALNRKVVQKTKDHDGPGARKAISNARAQHITEDIGGEYERDALDKVQAIYKHTPSKPAGSFYQWNKYKEGV